MKHLIAPIRLFNLAIPGGTAPQRQFARSILRLILWVSLAVPLTSPAELLYFCSPPQPVASGPWQLDVNVDGTPDLQVAVAGQNLTVLPAINNSVLATNRSYYTNLPSSGTPVLVGFPDEVVPVATGATVSFAMPSSPFWRERTAMDNQPLNLPLTFAPGAAAATNFFAVKVRVGNNWVLAWVRARVTAGGAATCALDWGYDTRAVPLVVNDMVIGARPVPATVRSTEKVLGIPLDDGTALDLDADGIPDVSFGGVALTTFGNGGVIIGGGTNLSSAGVLTYGLTTAGQTEVLRENSNARIFASGAGIADFVPTNTVWVSGNAGLASIGLGMIGLGYTNSWTGSLAAATNGYVGLRVFKDNNFYYGWIHLQLTDPVSAGLLGPVILGWAMESRPGVPIVAGDPGVAGEVVLIPPTLVGSLAVVDVSGLSRGNVILSSSPDLLHWTPVITNSVPFHLVYPISSPEAARYFRAMVVGALTEKM